MCPPPPPDTHSPGDDLEAKLEGFVKAERLPAYLPFSQENQPDIFQGGVNKQVGKNNRRDLLQGERHVFISVAAGEPARRLPGRRQQATGVSLLFVYRPNHPCSPENQYAGFYCHILERSHAVCFSTASTSRQGCVESNSKNCMGHTQTAWHLSGQRQQAGVCSKVKGPQRCPGTPLEGAHCSLSINWPACQP